METVKQFISSDSRNRLDIRVNSDGQYRYVTFDDRFRNDPDFQAPPEWTVSELSGLYETLEAAEAEALAKFVWLHP